MALTVGPNAVGRQSKKTFYSKCKIHLQQSWWTQHGCQAMHSFQFPRPVCVKRQPNQTSECQLRAQSLAMLRTCYIFVYDTLHSKLILSYGFPVLTIIGLTLHWTMLSIARPTCTGFALSDCVSKHRHGCVADADIALKSSWHSQ